MNDNSDRGRLGSIASLTGIALNLILAVIKIITGLTCGLVSVTADAVNNFSDASASVVSLVSFKLSSKPSDDEHPFGHARYEYIAALVVSFLILFAGSELLKTGISKIIEPQDITVNPQVFVILGLSIATKLFMAFFYRTCAEKTDSSVLSAASEDSRNDVVATSAVLISALVFRIKGVNLDGWMACAVSLYILIQGVGLISDTIKPLLGQAPGNEMVEQITQVIEKHDNVCGIHDLMVHDYGPGHCFASVHVEVQGTTDAILCHNIADRIENEVNSRMGINLVVHIDPVYKSSIDSDDRLEFVTSILSDINEGITIHDFKSDEDSISFDCIVPKTCSISDEKIRKILSHAVHLHYHGCRVNMNIDHSIVSLN